MQIDWSRYVRTAKEQGLTGIEVVRLIQKETNRKVNVSEVKRRLAGTESSTLGFEAETVDVIDLIEEDQSQETILRVNANGITFEFRALSPEDSVVGILTRMNIHLQDVHVTLIISPTDLRCGYQRLHSIAQDQLGINLNGGKEAVVFIFKTRRICKIITPDNRGTMLLTRTLHHGRFEELLVRVGERAKCALTLPELERFLNGGRLYYKAESFWQVV